MELNLPGLEGNMLHETCYCRYLGFVVSPVWSVVKTGRDDDLSGG